ncbi:MAG: hypothetical protein ABR535_00695 [Pyrinomonadaceae bacterium]
MKNLKTDKSNRIINFIKRLLPSILGILFALIVAEVCLRSFALRNSLLLYPTQLQLEEFKNYTPKDSEEIEIRQFQEGFAVSHFRGDGDRFTGAVNIENAPNVLILGDSFVEAVQVEDSHTMGAVIERLAAKESKPVNVHQYGWGGVSTATYLAIADAVKQRWNPQRVAVVFNGDDFSEISLATGRFWRMEINAETLSYKVVPVQRIAERFDSQLERVGFTSTDVYKLVNHSALLYLVIEKYLLSKNSPDKNQNNENSAKDSSEQKIVTSIIVKALKEAYGEKLLIIYIPQISVNSNKEYEPAENFLQSACENENVNFISTRNAMINKRDKENLLSQGFFNTPPGVGHLNQIGHEVVAEEIWKKISNY